MSNELFDVESNVFKETRKEKKVKRGQVWQLGKHKLMCGDASNREDVVKLMGEEKADIVITDPPYGVSYVGGNSPRRKSHKLIKNDDISDFGQFINKSFSNISEFMKSGSSFYCFFPSKNPVFFNACKNSHIYIYQQF